MASRLPELRAVIKLMREQRATRDPTLSMIPHRLLSFRLPAAGSNHQTCPGIRRHAPVQGFRRHCRPGAAMQVRPPKSNRPPTAAQ